MSIPEKIEYGGAPRTFNQSCLHGIEPQTAQYLADFLNNLAVSIYALGNPRIAGGSDAEDLPLSDPPRNKVRFKLTDGFSDGAAPAVGVDGTGGDVLTPAFTVYDPMGRYTSAGVGDYGIASYYQYPNGVYRLEVDVLGGEGTVTGTANDEKVKVTGDDDLEKHLLQCIYNADGTLPGAVSATVVTGAALPAGYQEVFAQEVTDSPTNDERMRLVTSSASATETYKVKCNDADTVPNFLHPTFVFATTQDYDNTGNLHVPVENATNPGELVSADQTEWLYFQKANLDWLAGCGLIWDESNVNNVHLDVDTEALAGDGLGFGTADANCNTQGGPAGTEWCCLYVKVGCALEIDEMGNVAVDVEELAGVGLAPNGCSIDIGVGCGLTATADEISVDAESLAGEGLYRSDTCTLNVCVTAPLYITGDCIAVAINPQYFIITDPPGEDPPYLDLTCDPIVDVSCAFARNGDNLELTLSYTRCSGATGSSSPCVIEGVGTCDE